MQVTLLPVYTLHKTFWIFNIRNVLCSVHAKSRNNAPNYSRVRQLMFAIYECVSEQVSQSSVSQSPSYFWKQQLGVNITKEILISAQRVNNIGKAFGKAFLNQRPIFNTSKCSFNSDQFLILVSAVLISAARV